MFVNAGRLLCHAVAFLDLRSFSEVGGEGWGRRCLPAGSGRRGTYLDKNASL